MSRRKQRWWNGWPVAAFLAVVVACLIYATGVAKHANAEILVLRGHLATETALLESVSRERDRLAHQVEFLLSLPPQIVDVPCRPRHHEPARVTPVFPRESQFSGVTH